MKILDLRACALLLTAFPIGYGFGAGMQIDLRILGVGENLTIEHCSKDACKPARVPESLKDRVAEGDSLSIEDINGDGMSEVVATSAHDVNACSSFYKYKAIANRLEPFDPAVNQICNHHVIGSYVISSYRDAGSWREDVYRRVAGRLVLMASDNCIGCGEVRRTVYEGGVATGSMIVSDELSYFDRKPAMTRVTAMRAALYSRSEPEGVTSMYLVKGDLVSLLDYSDAGDGWYKIRYVRRNGSALTKWMRCNDLAACAKP